MSVSKQSPDVRAHQEWLDYLQPVGLVVSPTALVAQGAILDQNQSTLRTLQERLREVLTERPRTVDKRGEVTPGTWVAESVARVLREFLFWPDESFVGGSDIPDALVVKLPEYGSSEGELRPTYAVRDPRAKDRERPWLALIVEVPEGTDLDRVATAGEGARWSASQQQRFERLLRETDVTFGVLSNKRSLRVVYRPALEAPGHVTFPWSFLMETTGRPALSALSLLLDASRVFSGGAIGESAKLGRLFELSREAQNEVSVRLAKQVFTALEVLLRGFESADHARDNKLLGPYLDGPEGREALYGGLLTVMLRLVFLLYAEDRKLLGGTTLYDQHYALWTLWDELRSDFARAPELLESRYGAWGRIVALSRLVHDGGAHGALRVPARKSSLFAPDAFPFLEGRARGAVRQGDASEPAVELPRISDSVVFAILEGLVFLDEERLSYSALGVEQLGSVYEAMMGYTLERALGPSIALGEAKVVVSASELRAVKADQRAAWVKKETGVKLNDPSRKALATAKTDDGVLSALELHRPSGPRYESGRLYLQPGEARRKSGTHYTPRTLTVPVVERALRPVIDRLGPNPTPDAILSLRVCDPAMGSGAFLVAACRLLAESLERAWAQHGAPSDLPPHEAPRFHAARMVAQRCLYGVDVNPFAVELGRLSLWLETLAGDHDFTFVDHALRAGDSLVGLTRAQLCSLHWTAQKQLETIEPVVRKAVEESLVARREIHQHATEDATREKQQWLAEAEAKTSTVRALADCVVAAWFSETKGAERKKQLEGLHTLIQSKGVEGSAVELRRRSLALRAGDTPVRPFHWELEFPEVFARENPGFDAFVGNPPFAGKNTIQRGHAAGYIPWLQEIHPKSHGNADLVAHFFRRAFTMLRQEGCAGLVATNTIAQGDTRSTGLRWICTHGGVIYRALRRYVWPVPGAAVIVSVVHFAKSEAPPLPCVLDGRRVPRITAFLFHDGGHEDPATLAANEGKSFQGAIILGLGFTFDDTSRDATPIAEMERLVAKDPRTRERIFPYLGGEELNTSPTQSHHRYVINFGQMTEEEARRWPALMEIVETRVRSVRSKDNRESYRRYWWQFAEKRVDLEAAKANLSQVLATARVSSHAAFAYVPAAVVASEQLVVFPIDRYAAFTILQSRVHEVWARFFASSLEDRLRYTPSDCFATFPFPPSWETNAGLEEIGQRYHAFRARLMADKATRAELMEELEPEGLTATYNRFHDRLDVHDGITQLRALHAEMDRKVLEAYGWWDELSQRADFACGFRDVHAEVDEGADSEDDADEADGDEGDERAPAVAATGARGARAKQRYGWSEAVRDEVLARLLRLNGERAKEEAAKGPAAKAKGASEARAEHGESGESGPLVLSGETASSGKKGAKGRGRKK
jgi:hypothetical protein